MTDYLTKNGKFKLNGKMSSKSCGSSSSSSSSTCEDNDYKTNQIKTEPAMIINEDDDYEDSVDDLTDSSKLSIVAKSFNDNNQSNRRKQHKPSRISNQEKELNNALLLKQKQQQLNEESSATNKLDTIQIKTEAIKPDLVISPKIESEKSSHLNVTANKLISSPSTTISDLLNLSNQQNSFSTSNSKPMDTFCTICKKEVCNKYFLKTHLLNKHGVQIEDYLAAAQQASVAAAAAVAALKQHQSLDLLSLANGLNSNLFNQSTSNNEDFCDLCQKQFCNKYYLKKHKLDVHGLNDIVKTNKDSNELISPTTPVPSTSPSKSLQAASPSSSTSSLIRSDLQANKSSLKQNDSSNILYNESFCEYCNKSFCNKYFLRTHMNKAHGKTLIIENNNTIIDNELNDSNGNETNETYFASKVVDRVVCDICNKQVCNKYFLRTHKAKVHGIDETQSTKSNQMKPDDGDQSQYNDYYDEDELEEGEQRKYNHLDEGEVVIDPQTKKLSINDKSLNKKRKYSDNSSASSLEYVSSSDCDDIFDSNAKKSKSLVENTSNMQPFMIEYDNSDEDDQFGKFFKSCMIYLPVKSKLNDSISVRVKLKPMASFIHENESNNDKTKSKMTN